MNFSWERVALGKVCEFVRGPFGGALKKSIFKESGFAVYEQRNAIYNQFTDIRYFVDEQKFSKMRRFELRPNDLIMSCSGTMGKIAIVPEGHQQGIINQALLKLTVGDKLTPRYLHAWMESPDFQDQLKRLTVGAAIKNVASVKNLKKIQIPLPPLEEQKRIVAVLDAAFEGLDRARVHTEANLQNARDLFESGLDAAFSPDDENWEVVGFGNTELLNIIDGDRGKNYPKKSDFHSEGHSLFLNTKNVRSDGFNFDRCQFIDEQRDALLSKGKLQPRDVLLTTRGTIGNIAVFDDSVPFDNIRINSGMIILRPNEGKLLAEYLFEVLRSGFVKKQIEIKTSGAAQPQLPIKTLVTIGFPVPKSTDEQSQLVRRMKALSGKTNKLIHHYQSKLIDLDDLRQSLLQKAFAGELT